MKSQSGFTLIEMVAVIILLAIMAATAMPRFINLSGDARLSALNGMVAALNSTRSLVKSKWIAANSGNLDTIDMGGAYMVSVIANNSPFPSSLDLMGIPAATTSGIWAALDNPTGFSSALTVLGGGPQLQAGIAFWPTGVATSMACYAFYDTSGIVTLNNTTGTSPISAPDANSCM